MSTSQTATAQSPGTSTRSSVASWAARVLLALYGILEVGATVYFGLFADEADGGVSGGVDWLIVLWSLAMGVGFLYCAVRLGDGTRRTLQLARGLVLAHVAFNLVKLVGYGESEAVTFFVIDAVLLGVLALVRRPA